MSTLSVFHYHLLTGGITQVVEASLSALLSHPEIYSTVGLPITRVRIVVGKEENAEKIRQKIQSAAEQSSRFEAALGETVDTAPAKVEVTLEIEPQLRYISEMERVPTAEEIKDLLLERYYGDIWWIHNYHIGKNPPFTEALLEIADEEPQQRMVFQIHDFPESGRFSNLELLYAYVHSPLYPIRSNVRYVVINRRDYEILLDAGIPEEKLFLLDNPIRIKSRESSKEVSKDRKEEAEIADREDSTSPSEKIRGYAGSIAGLWEEGGACALYPVRTIARKNVLEAGLLMKLLPTPINLLVTLPGTSSQQIAYSDFVGECFADGLIPGLWPIGTYLDKIGITFDQLVHASDFIISSSVQEGFGYLFLDALKWMKPLIARDLDILDGMREIFEEYPARFYSSLRVPLGDDSRSRLLDAYRTRVLPDLERVMPKNEVEESAKKIEKKIDEEYIDFSFLSLDLQRETLERLSNPAFRKEIQEVNNSTIEHLTSALEERTRDKSEEISERFGLHTHAEMIGRILDSFTSTTTDANVESTKTRSTEESGMHKRTTERFIHANVRHRFNDFEYMRLLYF